MRVTVVKVGPWVRTFRLPGYWRLEYERLAATVRKPITRKPVVTITSSPAVTLTTATTAATWTNNSHYSGESS